MRCAAAEDLAVAAKDEALRGARAASLCIIILVLRNELVQQVIARKSVVRH